MSVPTELVQRDQYDDCAKVLEALDLTDVPTLEEVEAFVDDQYGDDVKELLSNNALGRLLIVPITSETLPFHKAEGSVVERYSRLPGIGTHPSVQETIYSRIQQDEFSRVFTDGTERTPLGDYDIQFMLDTDNATRFQRLCANRQLEAIEAFNRLVLPDTQIGFQSPASYLVLRTLEVMNRNFFIDKARNATVSFPQMDHVDPVGSPQHGVDHAFYSSFVVDRLSFESTPKTQKIGTFATRLVI